MADDDTPDDGPGPSSRGGGGLDWSLSGDGVLVMGMGDSGGSGMTLDTSCVSDALTGSNFKGVE